MALEASDALTQLVIFAGVIIGSAGWTVWQYLKAQAKFQEGDIDILFDKKFLATAATAVITSFILVSGSFNTFLDKVVDQGPVTYVAAFFAALGLGFTFNAGANALIPSVNKENEKKLIEHKAAQMMTAKGIDLEKLSNMSDGEELHRKTQEAIDKETVGDTKTE